MMIVTNGRGGCDRCSDRGVVVVVKISSSLLVINATNSTKHVK